jgi:hypothetical protein
MSKSTAVPEDLYNKAVELAALLASRLATREYIETRAQLFSREAFERALNAVPDVEPEPYDRQ